MTRATEFNFRHYRIDPQGEPFRRLHVYMTQVDGKVTDIEACEPLDDAPSQNAEMADLIGWLDTYRDGQCVVTIHYEGNRFALTDFANEYSSLTPVDMLKSNNSYLFRNVKDRIRFQLRCGA